MSLKQAIANWPQSSIALRESMDSLFEVLEPNTDHFPGGKEIVGEQFHDTSQLIAACGGKRRRS